MARSKSKKKAVAKETAPPVAAANEDGTMTEDESLHDKNEDGDVPMDTEDDIPDIVDKDSDDDDKDDDNDIATTKQKIDDNKNTKKKDKKKLVNKEGTDTTATPIPFMDTFYLLSSEESSTQRAIAARDLINYCFPPPPPPSKDSKDDEQVNYKDAAYALTRLFNGLCTGRAASRQGFASCLSSFIRVSYPHLKDVLKEDTSTTTTANNDQSNDEHPAMIIRKKLLSTTDFLTPSDQDAKGGKKNKFGGIGKMKGMEERDHVFGRLFGILAIVRSGTLSMSDFPKEVSPYKCFHLI